MAIAKKCDRCGSLYEVYDGIGFTDTTHNKWTGMMLCAPYANGNNKAYDLCPNCMKALLSFLSKPSPKMVLDFMKKGDMDSIKKAFELRDNGKSLDEIAEELGYKEVRRTCANCLHGNYDDVCDACKDFSKWEVNEEE